MNRSKIPNFVEFENDIHVIFLYRWFLPADPSVPCWEINKKKNKMIESLMVVRRYFFCFIVARSEDVLLSLPCSPVWIYEQYFSWLIHPPPLLFLNFKSAALRINFFFLARSANTRFKRSIKENWTENSNNL